DYGLTPRHLESLQFALDNSIRDEADFNETKLKKKKSKAKFEQRIRENNLLLKKKLDRMMHLFRDSQKTFYGAYIKSRIAAEAEGMIRNEGPAATETPAVVVKKPATRKPAGTRRTATKKPPTGS
ncbi:MAG: hypothetical protein KAT15_03820, partial [Bacteroidales bacterium]|nr:hypothetical protein [Bacteroidales bacterium]